MRKDINRIQDSYVETLLENEDLKSRDELKDCLEKTFGLVRVDIKEVTEEYVESVGYGERDNSVRIRTDHDGENIRIQQKDSNEWKCI